MSNKITTKSVIELIVNNKKEEQYAIPYYQRGYRWEPRHVQYLLNDINTFMDERNDLDYCLQPIVVTPSKDEKMWEVIDGQQRLITLFLIFQCIGKPRYQIHFLQRPKSTAFLQKLNENTYSDDEPDFHYMSDAYKTIKDYFDEKLSNSPSYADKFYVAMERVKVIWYELDTLSENEKIDIFNRLNIGKIPLTDAELIRALLLSKIKIGKEREDILRQAEISDEWNRIEHELRNKEFWYFLNEKPQKNDASHIEFIFNLMAGGEAENYTTYLWFEKQINDGKSANELWNSVKKIFGQLKSWYNKRTLYHYIGFLIETNHKYSIQSLMAQQSEVKTKSSFEIWLKECIKNEIKDIDLKSVSYDENKTDVNKILLLFNVLTLNELKLDIPQNRFSFYRFKTMDGGWSIEHIHAQNSEELKDPKQIITWLEKTRGVLLNIKSVEKTSTIEDEKMEGKKEETPIKDYVEKIDTLLAYKDKMDVTEFNKLKQDLSNVFDSYSVHELSNLALLAKKDNSSLQNYIFPVKRDIIIDLEKRGHFIPLCTKMVFLKGYSNADYQPFYWSEKDKEAYFSEIERIINTIIK